MEFKSVRGEYLLTSGDQRLFEVGESAEGKAAQETQMILNHKAAIEMLADQAQGIGFNRYTICNLHALLSDNLLADPAAGGQVRSRPVGISGTVFHPLEVPQQIEERFTEILKKAARQPGWKLIKLTSTPSEKHFIAFDSEEGEQW